MEYSTNLQKNIKENKNWKVLKIRKKYKWMQKRNLDFTFKIQKIEENTRQGSTYL